MLLPSASNTNACSLRAKRSFAVVLAMEKIYWFSWLNEMTRVLRDQRLLFIIGNNSASRW